MKFLKRASVSLTRVAWYSGGGYVPVLNILGALSNATQLILWIESPELKNFNNVKELFIGMYNMTFDFNLVASFLKLSPNVEKLMLMLDVVVSLVHFDARCGTIS